MLSVTHNLTAMNSQRQFNIIANRRAKSTEKLSSGYKINRAADDAAGLAISEKMRRQIRGLNQGAYNIQDGISLCQVADGALAEVNELLHRMNELAVKSANETNTDVDRSYIQSEVDALTKEINRIGQSTTFNEQHIFDKATIEQQVGKITQLITSPSAENSRMNEAYLAPNGKYYPAASIDFSNVNPQNVKQLDNGEFSFVCPYGCQETFSIRFTTGDSPSNLVGASANTHEYTINIKDAQSGSDVVAAIYNYVSTNLPAGVDTSLSATVGGVGVSHSSAFVKNGDVLTVLANTPLTTEAQAKAYGSLLSGRNGAVDCSGLTNIMTPEPVFTMRIQCSSNVDDAEYVKTRWMNGEVLHVDPLDISSADSASKAIDKVKFGLKYISDLRSDLGAQQNRLEHSYNINLNVSENTTAAESEIRDTDMAKEMVSNSLQNILAQAGLSMMSQANQSNQDILSLLS